MKEVMLILCLMFGAMIAEDVFPKVSDSEIGKRRSFFGIEGGVGFSNYYPNYLVLTYINPFAIGYLLDGKKI